MRKYCCIPLLTCLGLTLSLGSQSASAQAINEGFEDITNLAGKGWAMTNASSPVGTTNWFQGSTAVFAAQAGAANAYIGANFNNTTGTNTISNWLFMPQRQLQNGKQLRFWTRGPAASTFPDRLQVRMSLNGGSINHGGSNVSVGDFSTLLLDINPTYAAADCVPGGCPVVGNTVASYPLSAWQEFVITLSGIGAPTQGRIAFRYFVENGGPTGANSNFIGIDTVSLTGLCTDPLEGCSADVFPVAQGDGTVNIDDLVRVITTWGQNNSSSNGPRPDADCAPLPNGDCLVDINDLVRVITTWGDCKGACCLSNGTCVANQTQSQCAAAGGTYQGHDVSCGSVVCPLGPPNDTCAVAAVANNGPNPFNNTNANTDGPTVATTCSPAPGMTRDVWFNYTASCTGHVTFDTLATASPFTDTVIQVFNTHACPPGAELGCNDDVSTSNFLSSLTVDLTTGQQVKVRVGSWSNTANNQGPGVLTINCAPVNDDNCIDATSIAVPSTTVGTIQGATQDVVPLCNGVAGGFGRWYKVTGNDTILTACTCDSPLQSWDARISVYCGTSCTNLFCVAASGTLDCGGADSSVPGCANVPASAGFGLHENVTWCAKAGQDYWILVHGDGVPTAPDGGYVLKVTSGASCLNPVVCFVPGDECATANSLPPLVVGPNSGSNVGMTQSPTTPTCVGAGNFNTDVFRLFTPPTTGLYEFTMCASTPSFDAVLAVYSGTCAAATQVGCDDDGCGGVGVLSRIASVNLTGGQTYIVRIGTWGTGTPAGQNWTMVINQVSACNWTCPPGSDANNEPCLLDAAVDTVNGGCNSTPTVFGTIVPDGPAKCGVISTYAFTTTQNRRDIDWYQFIPAASGNYNFTVNAEFGAVAQVLTGTNAPGAACGTLAVVASSTITTAGNCDQVTSPLLALTAGTRYVIIVTFNAFTGLPCAPGDVGNRYWVRLNSAASLANDECAGATVVTPAQLPFNQTVNVAQYTTNATDPDTSCELGGGGPFAKVGGWWYTFTPSASGPYTIKTCLSAAVEDSVIGIFTGACGSLTQVSCDDDSCETAPALGRARIVGVNLTAGTQYRIFVDNYSGGGSGGATFGPVRVDILAGSVP